MNVKSIKDVIIDVVALLDNRYKFAQVARAVKLSVEDLQLYSKSLIAFQTDIAVIKDDMTIDLPEDWGSVTKVAKITSGLPIQLDRGNVLMTKQRYAQQQKDFQRCANCNCSNTETVDYVPTSLPDATGAKATESYCPAMTFFNYRGQTCRSRYMSNFGTFEVDEANNRLYIGGLAIGDELLVEHKVDNDDCLLIPAEAFDSILYKAKSYLEPTNLTNEQLYRQYRKRFDLFKERETYTLETIFRSLQR